MAARANAPHAGEMKSCLEANGIVEIQPVHGARRGRRLECAEIGGVGFPRVEHLDEQRLGQ